MWTVLIAVLLAASGCDIETPRDESSLPEPPCGQGSARVELGRPRRGGPTAEFTTAGGALYVTASGFPGGGYFDPDQWRTTVYFGPADEPPTYDQQRSIVSNFTSKVPVLEDEFTETDLPAGRYWLWTTNGGEIAIVSCEEDGVSDASPVIP